jgi:hypothetical protein
MQKYKYFYLACVFNAGNGTNSFYVQGCIVPVGNIVVSQLTGIAVINVCLFILSIAFLAILLKMFPYTFNPNNPATKQPLQNEMQNEQQMQNPGYYATNGNPNVYYAYPVSTYTVYQ